MSASSSISPGRTTTHALARSPRRASGLPTTYVTPALQPSAFAVNTLEAAAIAKRLVKAGVMLVTRVSAQSFDGAALRVTDHLSGETRAIPAQALVTVTARLPGDDLDTALRARLPRVNAPPSLSRIGDCNSPSTIQSAVYAGHRWARQLDEADVSVHYPRELPRAEPLRRFWT